VRHVDFLVVGSGPAGQKGAIQAAKLGKRVCLVERRSRVGGVTVHTGTIPSKTLREAVLYLSGWRQRCFYGRGYRLKHDVGVGDLMERLDVTIAHEIEVIRDQLYRNGVETVDGRACFVDPHRVRVEKPGGELEDVTADRILLATGTRPLRPRDVPFDDTRVIDSDGILRLEKLPRTMTVIGAGVIGVEYATIFSALDVKVSLVDGRDRIMAFLDREIVSDLEFHLRDRGVVLRLGEHVAAIERIGDKVVTRLESGKQLWTDLVLFAAGRAGCTDELNLGAAGLAADDKGRLAVDARFRTAQPHIYAAGDVIGFPSLASTSMEQGRLAACDAFGQESTSFPEFFPFGVYAVPEISMVGATEQELAEKEIPYESGVARLRETARGQILGIDSGVLKILFSLETRRVLGVHILGEGATELIHIGQAALALGGTLEYFVENVFNYPTLAEAYKIAALDAWNRMPRRVDSGRSGRGARADGASANPTSPAALPEPSPVRPPEGRALESSPSA
jgi:NAD(P) transhydrogenase